MLVWKLKFKAICIASCLPNERPSLIHSLWTGPQLCSHTIVWSILSWNIHIITRAHLSLRLFSSNSLPFESKYPKQVEIDVVSECKMMRTSVVFRNLMTRQYIVVFLIKIIRLECFYLTIIGFRFVESVQRSISFQWIPFKWHSVAFMSLRGITINAFVLTLIIFLTIWIYFNP